MHWQKAGVYSHIERNIFETGILNTEELRTTMYNVSGLLDSGPIFEPGTLLL